MIDYIKIHGLPVSAKKMLNNELLTFPLSNVSRDGELLNRSQIAHLKNLQIIAKGEKVGFRGSIHKYHENGTNYRDFDLLSIQKTIRELSEKLHFDPDKAFINFVEIGLNIPLSYSPSELIKTLVIYRNNPFETLPVKGKGYGRKCETQRFIIKVYDKSLQYGLPFHLLRFEVKVKRTEFLKHYNIESLTLADLTRPDIYSVFLKMLLETMTGILFFDPKTNPDSFSNPKDRELFIEGRYPEYWQNLPKSTKNRKIKRFSELAGTEKMKNELSELISKKWNQLTTLQNELEPLKTEPINHFKEIIESVKTEPINLTIKGYFVPLCPVTNLPFRNQKPDSKYLSAKGVKWYYENDPETYKIKLETLLTDKWMKRHSDQNKKDWFLKIYHQIRNRANNPANNPRNNTKNSIRKIEGKGLQLFSIWETISPEKLKLII